MTTPTDPRTASDDESALDDATLAWLSEAVVPEPLNELQALRIKRRLLARIAEAQRSEQLTVQADEGRWKPFGPGLSIKVLHQASAARTPCTPTSPAMTAR